MRAKIQFTFLAFAAFIFFSVETPVPAQTTPAIVKHSIRVRPYTLTSYRENYDQWSWIPEVSFRINGGVPSGGQLYVEFSQPGGGAWVKFDCESGSVYECGGRDRVPDDKSITAIGPVTFAIKMRNELAGTDVTLFTGKTKIEKARSDEQGPKAVNKVIYFVSYDWALPIGFVYSDKNILNVAFWVRGDEGRMEPHLFYKGTEVGKNFEGDMEVGAPGCTTDIEILPTRSADASVPQKAIWKRVVCDFNNVKGQDTGAKFGWEMFYLDKNPGEYEFKLLRNKSLARSIKFTVGAGGKLDYSVAESNKLGTEWMVVPVQVIGDQDGTWNRTAWKTDAFFGNPLTGFIVP